MKKHAYLLMIHEYNDLLNVLLSLLDDQRNDIYIHVDKKTANFPFELVTNQMKKAGCYFTRRISIDWGTSSIMKCEIQMLKEVVKQSYQYVHLISGADLPMKTQEEIHSWFALQHNKEFIHFGTEDYQNGIVSRYQVYHFFMKQLGRTRENPFWNKVETYSLAVQRRLHINRCKHRTKTIYGGANWFSITGEFAAYIVANYKRYMKFFYFTQNNDEMWLQTMVMDSLYKNNLYHQQMDNDYRACMRYIDWNRGNPYVFRKEDFEELMKSDCMFARKFDNRIDREIIEKIYQQLSEK